MTMTEHEEGEVDDFTESEGEDASIDVPVNRAAAASRASENKKPKKRGRKHSSRKRDQESDSRRPPSNSDAEPYSKKRRGKHHSSQTRTPNVAKCKYYMEGRCNRTDCPYSHDFKPPKKPELCRYYVTGNCAKGDSCVFYHADFPCKHFHTGKQCRAGPKCRFSHAPLTAETRALLDKCLTDASQNAPANHPEPNQHGDVDYRELNGAPRVPFGAMNPAMCGGGGGGRPPFEFGYHRPPGVFPMRPSPMMRPPIHSPGVLYPPMLRSQLPPGGMQSEGEAMDMDYRGLSRMQLPPHCRFTSPPRSAPMEHPHHMLPRHPHPHHAHIRTPHAMRPPGPDVNDELDKMAHLLAKESRPSTDNPEPAPASVPSAVNPTHDPRLASSQAKTRQEEPPPAEQVKRPTGKAIGGLPRKPVTWRLIELDLSDRLTYAQMNQLRSDQSSVVDAEISDPRLRTGLGAIFRKKPLEEQSSAQPTPSANSPPLRPEKSELSTAGGVNGVKMEKDAEEASVTPPVDTAAAAAVEGNVAENSATPVADRKPFRFQLNEMASAPATSAPVAADRSYLADPRFRRKKIVVMETAASAAAD